MIGIFRASLRLTQQPRGIDRMMPNERLVLIEWEDSHGGRGWEQIDSEIEDRALVCRSVGWLVLDGERAKVIAPHLSTQEAGVALQASGVMTIPARAVLSITDLQPTGRYLVSRTPDIWGGSAVISGSAIPVFMIEDLYNEDCKIEDVLGNYPWLSRAEVLSALAYAADYPEQVAEDRSRHESAMRVFLSVSNDPPPADTEEAAAAYRTDAAREAVNLLDATEETSDDERTGNRR